MKIVRVISRILLGLVFIFSGVVKAVDPLGSAYKFHDYFQAFNIGFLNNLTLPLAILLCTAEFLAGFSVLTGLRQKTGIWVVMMLMMIFTPLTFILALTNPVSDCGCFGDAIHLTNWETFLKNIVLLIPAIILFRDRKQTGSQFKITTEILILGFGAFLFITFSLFNLRYLPVIDFLPYKMGIKIADQMVVPEGAEAGLYRTTFIYERDGQKKEFTLDDYPANDTSWKFIDQKSVLIKKGYQPPIHDFIVTAPDGTDITKNILTDPGYSLLMVSRKLEDAKYKSIISGFGLGKYCTNIGIKFYILTSTSTYITRDYNNGLEFCSVDETSLKTMVRSNPGYILLKDGVIAGKWSWANIPGNDYFSKLNAENNN